MAQQMQAAGHIVADQIVGTEFVTVEVSGMKVDGIAGRQSGELVMSPESVLYAIWALAKSVGKADEIEAFLSAQFPSSEFAA